MSFLHVTLAVAGIVKFGADCGGRLVDFDIVSCSMFMGFYKSIVTVGEFGYEFWYKCCKVHLITDETRSITLACTSNMYFHP